MNDLCLELVTPTTRCQLLANHIVPHSDDPENGFIPLPTEPWNEIVPRLWQGGSAQHRNPVEGDFDAVLTLYRNATFASAPVLERRFHFADGDAIPAGLSAAVDWVYQQWALQKRHVLVRCQAGLNRSGLVVALVLHKDGHDVDDAIRLIQEKRSPYALCNRFFLDHLASLR